MKTIASLFLIIMLAACGEQPPRPFAMYQADYNPDSIEITEKVIDEIATLYGFEVFRKNRKEMSILTQDTPAFFTALYFSKDPVLVISNVGVGRKLSIHATDFGHMNRPELEQALKKLIRRLNTELNIKLEVQHVT